ncbi:MFS transporter [Hyphobacterium sp.]|uniref:MFS transporter n=1 Tax=Hyphobacterium sp. TaxID=2004662 RepID=UPI003BABDF33
MADGTEKASRSWLAPAFQAIAIDDEGRTCRDIPDSACREEAGNFFRHVGALSLSKSADGLIDPKLVLSWLILQLGAPAALVGFLVPIREAGALLPQLFTAGALRRLPQRKWAWAAGAALQALAALSIGLIAVFLEGALAGALILLALTVLALARSVCSVCYKDVLGKTVDKTRRGRATGLAGTIASVTVIVFALALMTGVVERVSLVTGALFLAALAWLAASCDFITLREHSGATDGGKAAFSAAIENMGYLKEDAQLRRFILVRSLLTSTALAPPFMVAAASATGALPLGALVLASASAALVSSYVWGWLSDRSSRKVLMIAGLAGAGGLVASAALALAGWLHPLFALPAMIFLVMIAYQGVRLGRSTHLTDMATEDTRAAYTALSNTIVGLVLIAGALFSLIAALAGPVLVLALMAGMALLATLFSRGLDEVQAR